MNQQNQEGFGPVEGRGGEGGEGGGGGIGGGGGGSGLQGPAVQVWTINLYLRDSPSEPGGI